MKYWCDPKLARAFFQEQKYHRRFSPVEALDKGTIFPELYCPYRYADGKHKSHEKEERNNESYPKRKTY
ncbi:MAG: spore coat associated protein CotJA [Syntrophomonadaceae bacterium]|jgi:hypothetical protein|nr:spore coat associated protein CotJA [Syntrophomonadaceae bacterium]